MPRRLLPEMSPWRRQPLTIPPDSTREWISLAAWECWMGGLVAGALIFAIQLIATAPSSLVTVFDFTNCYAAPPVMQPCERIAYRTGGLNVMLNLWCGVMLIVVAAWLLWELWNAVTPKPITDDFLKLLHDSFGRDWRRPRTWPWARVGWAYGFTFVGGVAALGIALVVSSAISSAVRPPAARVETSQSFRRAP